MDINNTAISNKLLFCKDRNINYNLRKNDTQDLTALVVSFIVVIIY